MINSAVFSQKEKHFLIQAAKISCFASKLNKVVAVLETLSLASLYLHFTSDHKLDIKGASFQVLMEIKN